jgi:ribose transport system substrate-binding protein
MSKPTIPILVAAILAAATLCGCGKEKPAAVPGQPGAPAAPTAAAAVRSISIDDLNAVKPAAKPYRLTLIVKTRNNPFFDPMIRAFEAEAKLLGATPDVQAPPQETDKEIQFSLVQTVTARGTDAILIAPADSKGIVPALKQAQDKGILVINIDNRVDAQAARSANLTLTGYVGANNEDGGKLAGEAMVKALNGKGNVAILEGIRGADNAEARKRGFEKGIDGKLTVVTADSANWETQQAYAKAQSMLAAYPTLNGIFCANDKMAVGALKAIDEAGKQKKTAVVGYDNIADVKPYLKSGEMTATIEQHPDLMGKYGARMAVGILEGSVPRSREFLVPLDVITR